MTLRRYPAVCFFISIFASFPALGQEKPSGKAIFRMKTEKDIQSLQKYWGNGGFSIDKTVFKKNGFSLKLDGGPSNAYRTEFVPYTPGDQIRIHGFVKSQNVVGKEGNTPLISIMIYDRHKNSMGHTDVFGVLNGNTDWQTLNGNMGPFNASVKYWTFVLSSNWLAKGTAWFNDIVVARVPRESGWQPMLLSRSFGVDEFQKGDWKVLKSREWVRQVEEGSHVSGRSTADPTLDWDGYKLLENPANISFDQAEVPEKYVGAQSLKLTGGATYATDYLPYAGEKLRFFAWIKYKDLAAGRADEVSKAGGTRGCLAGIQIAAFIKRGDKYFYQFHTDQCLVIDGVDRNSEWVHLGPGELSFSRGITHLQIWIRMWEGRTGTLWAGQVRLDKLARDQMPTIKEKSLITVRGKKNIGPMKRIWLGVDTMVCDLLTENSKKYMLPALREAGLEYVRVHWPLLGVWDQNDAAGKPIYDFTGLDAILDELKKNDLKPMIITEPTPLPLISKTTKNWVNTSPPKDLKQHGAFIEAVARHCIERYGKEQVEQWYWECWNEPWPPYYFDGSLEDYLRVCDYTVTALKKVNPKLKFGSLAYGDEKTFWGHFSNGINAATGKPGGVPIDYITYHGYSGQGLPSLESVRMQIKRINGARSAYPKLKDLPLINGEWNACYIGCEVAETVYNAAAVGRALIIMADEGVDQTIIHCLSLSRTENQFFGLNTIELFSASGVPTAAINTYRFLNHLSGKRVGLERTTEPVDGLASVNEKKKELAIFLTNFVEDPYDEFTTAVQVNIEVPEWMAGKTVRIEKYIVDKNHGDPYTVWQKIGKPMKADPKTFDQLMKAGRPFCLGQSQTRKAPQVMKQDLTMPAHSIGLILLKGE
jgi:xylan 1,4-beta-xylosidase